MNSFTPYRTGRKNVRGLARHIQCITSVDSQSRRKLDMLKAGYGITLSYQGEESSLTLRVRHSLKGKYLMIENSGERDAHIDLPSFYQPDRDSLAHLYSNQYITFTGKRDSFPLVHFWMERSRIYRTPSKEEVLTSILRSGRYWTQYLLPQTFLSWRRI